MRIPNNLTKIMNIFKEHGYKIYLVGGSLRDMVLKKEPKDYDLATDALPLDTKSIMEKNNIKVLETGLKFGTVTVMVGKDQYEVTTFRIDGDYSNLRHPDEVIFSDDIIKDLSRRDFTMNALAYNEEEGFIDPFLGKTDIENKIIRSVRDPKDRFKEDALRMLRAIRFVSQLNFKLEDNTKDAILNLHKNIRYISKERIREELIKTVMGKNPKKAFKEMVNTKILKEILPELYECVGFNQENPFHTEDIFNHTLSVIELCEDDLEVKFAALLHDIGKAKTFTKDKRGIGHFYNHEKISYKLSEKILERLKFSNKFKEDVLYLVLNHMTIHEKMDKIKIKKMLNNSSFELLEKLFKLQTADALSSHKKQDKLEKINNCKILLKEIKENADPISIKDLSINGNNLISLGLKQKQIGIALKYALNKVIIDPDLNNKTVLLKLIEENMSNFL